MLTIYDIQLTDILPASLKDNADMKALSYALSKEMELTNKVIPILDAYSDISKMPDVLCDYMAVELDVLYYDTALPVERKRELIKNAAKLHAISGSYKATEIMANSVLGKSKVKEWFKLEGVGPYQFDIITSSTLTQKSIDYIRKIIDKVKPRRSLLQQIQISHDRKAEAYIGGYKDGAKLKDLIYE